MINAYFYYIIFIKKIMQKRSEIFKKHNFLGQALDFLPPRKPGQPGNQVSIYHKWIFSSLNIMNRHTVFFLIYCGQKNNYFGHATLIIRGDKLLTFHRPKSALNIREKFDRHRTKLERKKITQFFLFNIFIFYFHYLSFFFFFVNFRFLLLFLHFVFHFFPLLLKFFNLNQCLFLHLRKTFLVRSLKSKLSG